MSNSASQKQARNRREHWRQMIEKQARSGLSIRAFCAQQGLRDAAFYAWRKQLRAAPPARFALVETGLGRPSAAPVEVVLKGGERLLVGAGADAATIGAVLAALRA